MSNTIYLRRQMRSFDSAPQFEPYSKVLITVSEDAEYSAGTDAGRVLKLVCPWGTQAMAENLLSKVMGFQYQPYTAVDARLDPAAELGDSVEANSLQSAIYTKQETFGSTFVGTVSAPHDEEIDHEYEYIPKQERAVNRSLRALTSEFKIQAGLIEATVKKTGGNPSSFGWALDESSWTIKSNNRDVLKASKDGLEVYGKITATSGHMGGFDIESDHLSYNGQTWGGTNALGGYFGVNGLQLGQNFRVTMAGELYATSGTFTGSVRAGSVEYGGENGTLNGAGLTGHSVYGDQIGYNSISTANTSGGINTSLGYADFANGVFNGWNTANHVYAGSITATSSLYVPYNGTTRLVNVVSNVTIDGRVYNILTI